MSSSKGARLTLPSGIESSGRDRRATSTDIATWVKEGTSETARPRGRLSGLPTRWVASTYLAVAGCQGMGRTEENAHG